LDAAHPLKGLSHVNPTEKFESSGITCFVRRNPLSPDQIESAARLCSQTILEVGAELGGRSNASWFLTRRTMAGVGKTYLRSYFGNAEEVFAGVPTLDEIRPRIDRWLKEVRDRRRQMGKD
jgi:hypothetical protein